LMRAFEELDQVYQNPKMRAQMVRNSFKVTPLVSVDRTAKEMVDLANKVSS
jgi:hypothetical protein